jgi:putative ABC transport system permease protein
MLLANPPHYTLAAARAARGNRPAAGSDWLIPAPPSANLPNLMAFRIALRQALRDLLRRPVRSFLLLQGVIWGTVLGIFPSALIRGSREAAVERAGELGTDRLVVVDPGLTGKGLDWGLVEEVRRRLPAPGSRREILPADLRSAALYARRAKEAGAAWDVLLVEGEALATRDYQLAAGRWLSAAELLAGAPAAVLEAAAAAALAGGGPSAALLGRALDLGDGLGPVTVVGVTRPRPSSALDHDAFGFEKEHPLRDFLDGMQSTFGLAAPDADWLTSEANVIVARRRYPEARPTVLELRAEPRVVPELARLVREVLLARGSDPTLYHNPVVQFLFSSGADFLEKVHWVIFFAGILAGTAVVTCMQVLSVIERRAEIAIRRVEGATASAIAGQFTLETAFVSLAGAGAGIPLALVIAWARARMDPSNTVTWIFPAGETAMVIAAVFACGLVGGLLPALRAARIAPASVLTRE